MFEPELQNANFIQEHNAKHMWHPMAHPADMRANPPKVIMAGQGVRITDVEGRDVIDAVGGLWNVNLGYSCDPVKAAIAQQLDQLAYYSAFRGTSTGPAVELSHMLGEWFAPDGLTRAFFTSGGSDSVETALRLARQYHKIRGQADRVKFLSLKKGYHGTHMGGASVNGNANFRRAYEPLLPGCFHVEGPYLYRNPFGAETQAALTPFLLAQLEAEIAFQGPDTIAAFIMEPVLGAGGVHVPHASFMPAVRDICDRHGILLIADEVITAFGRTGGWTGSRLWGVQPDLMATAKAITNGYFPFGAVMIHERVADVFESDTSTLGSIGHGYTYSAHPVGAAAALACVPEITRLNVHENAAARGAQLKAGLERLMQTHEVIGDVRGQGLMLCAELVGDRDTKAPLDPALVAKVFEATYAAGTMVRISGNNLIMSPPLILTEAEADTILTCLDAGFSALA